MNPALRSRHVQSDFPDVLVYFFPPKPPVRVKVVYNALAEPQFFHRYIQLLRDRRVAVAVQPVDPFHDCRILVCRRLRCAVNYGKKKKQNGRVNGFRRRSIRGRSPGTNILLRNSV